MAKLIVTKWWWAWHFEKIETWLEEMESKGFQLSHVSLAGIRFEFNEKKPQKARYCIDYQMTLNPEYLQLLNDDGWSIYSMGANWYVLRKEYTDHRPDFYNDVDPIISRFKKIIGIIVACFTPVMIAYPNLSLDEMTNKAHYISIEGLWIALVVFYIFAIVKLFKTIQFFENKKKISGR